MLQTTCHPERCTRERARESKNPGAAGCDQADSGSSTGEPDLILVLTSEFSKNSTSSRLSGSHLPNYQLTHLPISFWFPIANFWQFQRFWQFSSTPYPHPRFHPIPPHLHPMSPHSYPRLG